MVAVGMVGEIAVHAVEELATILSTAIWCDGWQDTSGQGFLEHKITQGVVGES